MNVNRPQEGTIEDMESHHEGKWDKESMIRDALRKIVKASEVPVNAVNFMPEMRLEVIAGEAKALLKLLDE